MKVLIVGGCATRAYVEFFQKCFPDWETRAALLVQVNEWVEEGNEAFLSYVESADIFVGLTDREPLKSLMPENALNIFLPSFDFFGYQPDSIFLSGMSSPLELGVIHSRIAASAYLAGKNEQEALALFNADHYKELGYFDQFDICKAKLFEKFDQYNIDLRERFDFWSKDGNFLYTVNHPHAAVFFDIACVAMKNHYPEMLSDDVVGPARESVDNYMGNGLVWAIYPELAEHLGIACSPADWRTSQIHKPGINFNLSEFISRSYQKYRDMGEFPQSNLKQLGGMEEILRYAGCDLPDTGSEQQVA